ncbi:hypothetical protein WN944_009392 [Citrus x changshan-huyou]|uniref:Uncharacterized protein n=1 Tax=Citrus x changshan-huyou TaxID=2935761 RepID=A0AAP0MUF8_9ROSI
MVVWWPVAEVRRSLATFRRSWRWSGDLPTVSGDLPAWSDGGPIGSVDIQFGLTNLPSLAIMYFLHRTPKDADILIQNGIIGPGDSEILSAALKRLRKDTLMGRDFLYANGL